MIVALADHRPNHTDLRLPTLFQLLRAGDVHAGHEVLRRLDTLEAWACSQLAELQQLADNLNLTP